MKPLALKNALITGMLLVAIALIVITTLVYQVSAVVLADRRSTEQWKKDIEEELGYTSCLVLDDSTRIIRILTLRCRKESLRYVHVAQGGTLVGESPVDAFDLESAMAWAKASYGDEVEVSLSYYQGQTVLRIHSPKVEILVDPLTRSELWKVDLTYE
jgi:hypothetical protein